MCNYEISGQASEDSESRLTKQQKSNNAEVRCYQVRQCWVATINYREYQLMISISENHLKSDMFLVTSTALFV